MHTFPNLVIVYKYLGYTILSTRFENTQST